MHAGRQSRLTRLMLCLALTTLGTMTLGLAQAHATAPPAAAPQLPTNLVQQYSSDGTHFTTVDSCGIVGLTGSIRFKANVSDAESTQVVALQVEVEQVFGSTASFGDYNPITESLYGANPHTGSVIIPSPSADFFAT